MSVFRNLSIKNKILSVVCLIVLLELVMTAGGVYFLNAVSHRMMSLVDVDAQKMKTASRIQADMLEIHRAQKNSILFDNPEQIAQQVESKNRYIAQLHMDAMALEQLLDHQEIEALVEFRQNLEAFLRIDRQIETLILKQDTVAPPAGTAEPLQVSYDGTAASLSTGVARAAYDSASDKIAAIVSRMDASLDKHRAESETYFDLALTWMLILCAVGIGVGWMAGLFVARNIAVNLNSVVTVTDAISQGKLDARVEVRSGDETGRLAASVKIMQKKLIEAAGAAAERDWIKTGIARLNDAMRGQVQVADLCGAVIGEIAAYLQASVGALFVLDANGKDRPELVFSGGYACSGPLHPPRRLHAGEGLAGQAVLSRTPIVVRDVPSGYLKVSSSLGADNPLCIVAAPLLFEDRPTGVAELGFFKVPSDVQLTYLQQVLPAVAIAIETVRGREKLAESLARAQVLGEELQQQQDELKAINEELEEQTQRLKQSEEQLKQQQNQLEEVNAELEEKNTYLQEHKQLIERANHQLETSKREIEEKAEQLALAGQYKSEFLANMSHELRTPLNSILLLARMLWDNRDGTLNPEQVRSAEIIHTSGSDLLTLINEVLDLSKIEAGRMDLHPESVDLLRLCGELDGHYAHMVRDKALTLDVVARPDCPRQMRTDRQRLNQILRNLISNAVKFTHEGGLRIEIGRPEEQTALPTGMAREKTVAIAVTDTGIGIPADKQNLVFDAFQQLDRGTARKFAGTGLGLSIARNMARLLGGDILLQSRHGAGSTFTLVLPEEIHPGQTDPRQPAGTPGHERLPCVAHHDGEQARQGETAPVVHSLADDRTDLGAGDSVILIIEDDLPFAEHLIGLCRGKKFKTLHAATGEQGLELAAAHLPKGILLDIHLPKKDGWSVLEALKTNPRTRHIPVHILSIEDATTAAFARGAVGFLTKPVQAEDLEKALDKLEHIFARQVKELLVVEDDDHLRKSLITLIGNGDVHCDEAASAGEAIAAVKAKTYDCMILDLGLPDLDGLEMLRRLEGKPQVVLPPVIVYTGREMTREQEEELQRYSESIIIKGVRSEERLYDEASLFLHRIVEKMPEKKRRIITNLYDNDIMFRDKTILIADDDMRSVFALSRILEQKGLRIVKAENGGKALELLAQQEEIDLVLMDMMMPVLDGYETMRRIRSEERWRRLPIIALTAKAMKQDHERCIRSGASDYLSKPVDMERLFSMMRVWLYR